MKKRVKVVGGMNENNKQINISELPDTIEIQIEEKKSLPTYLYFINCNIGSNGAVWQKKPRPKLVFALNIYSDK